MKQNVFQLVGGLFGTSMSAVGTALQTSEVMQIISLAITIIGGIISMIVIPLLNWYREAKKDGKVTVDEIGEGVNTLQEGLNGVKNIVDENKDKKEGD